MSYLFSFATKGQAPTTIAPSEASPNSSTSTVISPVQADRRVENRTKSGTQSPNQSSPVKDAVLHGVKRGKIMKPNHDRRKKRSSFFGLDRLASLFNGNKVDEDGDLDGETLVNNDNNTNIIATGGQYGDSTPVVAHGDEYTRMVHGYHPGRSFTDYHGVQNNKYDDARLAEWTETESWLMAKLRSRGRYPVFDRTWHIDFWWFPRKLFTSDTNRVIVNNTNANICRGKTPSLNHVSIM